MKSHSIAYLLAALALAATPTFSTAQTNTFPASGNVGIGTTTPASKLEIIDSGVVQTTPLVLRNEFGSTADLKTVGLAFRGGNGYWAAIYGGQQLTNNWSYGSMSFGTRTSDAVGVQTKMTILANGNVGIGTASPSVKFHIAGTGAGMTIAPDAASSPYIDLIGLNSQTFGAPVIYFLSAANSTFPTGGVGLGTLSFRNTGWGEGAYITGVAMETHSASTAASELRFGTSSSGAVAATQRMVISSTGNVGIGTTSPTYPLTVNGAVRAKEVIVDTGWSDYVFAPGYHLAPLSEVEQQIKEEHHLPGIPSAAEVKSAGVNIGEMQARLLAKIEELTLRQIDQDKQLKQQAERIRKLETENEQLRLNR